MLPENLPDLPQLRVAARYEAGVDGNAAGGDFYDAFVLPDGCLGIVLGDVAGHDVQAAARMGQVRAALRALALNDSRPDRVLTGVDRLVANLGAEGGTDELFVTVVFGVLDPDGARMTLSSAGHPAPLLRRCTPEGEPTARYLDLPTGTPLGLGGHRVSSTVEFVPGDTLLLYSDGVIERRRHSLSAGLAALAGAVAAAGSGDPPGRSARWPRPRSAVPPRTTSPSSPSSTCARRAARPGCRCRPSRPHRAGYGAG